MKHRTFAMICASGALAISQIASAAPAPDAKLWSGSWQLNSEKSKFSSAEYTPKKDTRNYSVAGNRVSMRSTMMTAQGKAIKWAYSARTDGKWYPASGNPGLDHLALTLLSARELKSEGKLKGKSASTSTLSVSPDGKQLTIKRSLVTPKGATDDTMVFDRTK
jgi:hypothetical protein